jgi:hypothetical protein
MIVYYNKYYKDQNKCKPVVLDYLFRNYIFSTLKEKIRAITISEYREISKAVNVPEILVHKFISKFLVDLIRFKNFFSKNPVLLNSKHPDRKVRIYLHKLHRMAPIFNYKRARENARRLNLKLKKLFFWPQIMTQVAIVIFITDLLDITSYRILKKIIQTNLRVLCCCSAYAFHRTRNKIGLTTDFIKNLSTK